MNLTFENIYDEYLDNFEEDEDYSYLFYKKHQTYLGNKRIFNDENELNDYLSIILLYLTYAFKKGYYKEIIQSGENILFIFEKTDITQSSEEIKKFFPAIIFLIALSHYKFTHYSKSHQLLTRLHSADPENELYNHWRITARYKYLSFTGGFIFAIFLICVLILSITDINHPRIFFLIILVSYYPISYIFKYISKPSLIYTNQYK